MDHIDAAAPIDGVVAAGSGDRFIAAGAGNVDCHGRIGAKVPTRNIERLTRTHLYFDNPGPKQQRVRSKAAGCLRRRDGQIARRYAVRARHWCDKRRLKVKPFHVGDRRRSQINRPTNLEHIDTVAAVKNVPSEVKGRG